MNRVALLFALLFALMSASRVGAQNTDAREANLVTGFSPDPRVYQGEVSPEGDMPRNPNAAATQEPAERDGDLTRACVGRTHGASMRRIRLRTRVGFLRVFATSETADLTLAVRRPDGAWLCSDDRFGNAPSIESTFSAGDVEVYVGVQGDASAHYELRLTETRSVRPRQSAEAEGRAMVTDLGLTTSDDGGTHGNIRLRRGFLPDPRTLTGSAGGEIDLAVMGSACRGFLGAAAAHRVELASEFDFFALHVERPVSDQAEHENAAYPATVLILGPSGQLMCQTVAPEEWRAGYRATVAEPHWAEGVYWVWIASSELNTTVDYRLTMSEVRRTR